MNTLSGDGKRYVYGVSYGTQLILRLLQLENTNIDGVILDSLVPLQDDDEYDLSHRSYVVNHVGNSVLSHFDGLTNTNKTTLAAQLKNSIQKAKEDPSFAKKLPKQALSILMGMMLDIPEVRATIPAVIGGLSNNNFEPLNKSIAQIQKFYTNYGSGFKTLPSSIPLVQVISASENNLRPTLKPEEVVKESEDLIFTSNLAKLLAENAMPTYKADAYFGKVPKKMPPMLIFHGTLDPKTHITGAIRHIEKLPKENIVRLIKVKDAPHFIALFAPKSFTRITSKFMRGKRIKNQTVRDANTLLK
jgi:pimeloyl-ACP methyl ester carboxylesterase